MARRFIVRPLAEANLEQAANWHDEEQAGFGSRFLSEVDQVFGRIRAMPLLTETPKPHCDELVCVVSVGVD